MPISVLMLEHMAVDCIAQRDMACKRRLEVPGRCGACKLCPRCRLLLGAFLGAFSKHAVSTPSHYIRRLDCKEWTAFLPTRIWVLTIASLVPQSSIFPMPALRATPATA